VAAACEFLGFEPLHVANEGKMIAIAPEAEAERALGAWRRHEEGRDAAVIGRVVAAHPRQVVARTPLGTRRLVRLPAGELLPRIC
jgi:hydrogenase expression/formation protein HypE